MWDDISLWFFFFFKRHRFLTFYLFTCFWLCCVFTAAPRSPGVDVGVLFAALRGLLIAVVSFVAEHGLQGMRAQSPPCRLSSAGSVVAAHCLPCSVTCGHLSGPGIEPMPSALPGFLTTDPPGKSPHLVFIFIFLMISILEQLSCTYWPFAYLVWQNTYSNSLPIFKTRLFLHCWVSGVLYTFWLWISYHICDLQISSPFP